MIHELICWLVGGQNDNDNDEALSQIAKLQRDLSSLRYQCSVDLEIGLAQLSEAAKKQVSELHEEINGKLKRIDKRVSTLEMERITHGEKTRTQDLFLKYIQDEGKGDGPNPASLVR